MRADSPWLQPVSRSVFSLVGVGGSASGVVVVVVVYVSKSVCLCLPVAAGLRTVGSNGVARLGSLHLTATCGHSQHSSGPALAS